MRISSEPFSRVFVAFIKPQSTERAEGRLPGEYGNSHVPAGTQGSEFRQELQ